MIISKHILEIRLRISYLLFSFFFTMSVSYYYQFELFYVIGRPFFDLDHKFILIDLTEAFSSILRICGIFSFFFILPFFFYHFWCFYIPSRYIFERIVMNNFLKFFCIILFLEIIILYFGIFPRLCKFLLSFEIMSANSSTDYFYNISTQDDKINKLSTTIIDLKKNIDISENKTSYNSTQIESEKFFSCKQGKDLSMLDYNLEKRPLFLELTARLESYILLSTRFFFLA